MRRTAPADARVRGSDNPRKLFFHDGSRATYTGTLARPRPACVARIPPRNTPVRAVAIVRAAVRRGTTGIMNGRWPPRRADTRTMASEDSMENIAGPASPRTATTEAVIPFTWRTGDHVEKQ